MSVSLEENAAMTAGHWQRFSPEMKEAIKQARAAKRLTKELLKVHREAAEHFDPKPRLVKR